MFGFLVRYLINEHETTFAFQMGVHDKYFKHLNRKVNRHMFIELHKVLYNLSVVLGIYVYTEVPPCVYIFLVAFNH